MLAEIFEKMRLLTFYFAILGTIFICGNSSAQNINVKYQMSVHNILYESLILYDDNTYKLTSEYDLHFETMGHYEIIENYIFLSESAVFENALKANPKLTPGSIATKIFKREKNQIFIVKKGKVKKRIVDKSMKKGLSDIFGHKYTYKKIN